MKIQVKLKTAYGRRMVYPECEKAKLFASIAGTDTLTKPTLDKIKQLGFTVEVIPDPVQEL